MWRAETVCWKRGNICREVDSHHNHTEATPQLKNWGVVLFRAFDGQDIFGPLDALQLLAFQRQMNLYLIAETLDPVTSEPASAAMNSKNSSFWPIILPTHTFANAPELDVLLVPGGAGVRAPDVKNITDFIADRYPSLEYLITVCTGAGLAAKSGVLDGKRATTNKSAWSTVTAWGPNVNWIRQARWVVDGNIWTAAGVSKCRHSSSTTKTDVDGPGYGWTGLDLRISH